MADIYVENSPYTGGIQITFYKKHAGVQGLNVIQYVGQSLPVLEIRVAFPKILIGKKWKHNGKFFNGKFQQNFLIHCFYEK